MIEKTNTQLTLDASIFTAGIANRIAKADITVVDTSMYFTPDGSTTNVSWKVTVV